MRNYEGIFKEMNAVVYFSCSGQSKAVAEDLAERLNFKLLKTDEAQENFGTAVVVFPVHCQSFPAPLKGYFMKLKAERVALIATYGRANCGNALYEAAKLIKSEIVAAAYLPAKHTYCVTGTATMVPEEVIAKMLNPAPVQIPKLKKTPFAGFLPNLRSRLIVKIKRTEKCVNCGICGGLCPVNAIENGKINSKCLRCLRCVYSCPHGALEVKKSLILKRYLRRPRFEKTIIYI